MQVRSLGGEDPLHKGMATHSSGLYPLPYPCPEHPTDRGAWEATVRGVAERRTCLKRLSTRAELIYKVG